MLEGVSWEWVRAYKWNSFSLIPEWTLLITLSRKYIMKMKRPWSAVSMTNIEMKRSWLILFECASSVISSPSPQERPNSTERVIVIIRWFLIDEWNELFPGSFLESFSSALDEIFLSSNEITTIRNMIQLNR